MATARRSAGVHEVVKADHHVDPVVGRRQRHLGLDDDAVGAVGVADLEDVRAGEVEHARLGLAGDDLEPQDIAEIAQPAPADRADAAGAAGDEAAERRHAVGRGVEAQLAGLRLGLLVELFEDDAGFGATRSGWISLILFMAARFEHDAARKRHGLAVIAGAGAARRDRHVMREGDAQRP